MSLILNPRSEVGFLKTNWLLVSQNLKRFGAIWFQLTSSEVIINSPNMMQPGMFLISLKVILKAGFRNERLSLINDFESIIRGFLPSEGVNFTEGVKIYYHSAVTQGTPSVLKSLKEIVSSSLSNNLGYRHNLKYTKSERSRKVYAEPYHLWENIYFQGYPDLTGKAKRKVKELCDAGYKRIRPVK